MRISVKELEEWFSEFNVKYFGGILPMPALSVGMSRTRLGSMSWRRTKKMFRTRTEYAIRISNYYDMDSKAFKSVLLHEMIHLLIEYKRLKDTAPHGVISRQNMDRINADGWNITVSARMNGTPLNAVRTNNKARIILAVVTFGGRHIVSVVSPRYVISIDRILKRSTDIKSFSWHISTDSYFAGFPVVRTPRGRVIPQDTYERLVRGMKSLDLPQAE